MPIPLILIGLGAATASLGVGKSIKAAKDQKDANETNNSARNIIETAKKDAETSRDNCNKAIEDLGRKKLWILDNSISEFIKSFEKIKNIELIETAGLDELKNCKFDKQQMEELKQLSMTASSILGGAAGGAIGGALAAFGAYSGAMALGTCATTGTAIASLSGAAATNATLAFLGGGALSVGGLGIAGGTAVLGGLVAGPALAIMGFIVGAKASANRDEAYSNYAKAKEFRETVKNMRTICKGIRLRANMFERLLIKLDAMFLREIYALETVIETSGTDCNKYSQNEKEIVARSLNIAKTIKQILDTPILNEDGSLNDNSLSVANEISAKIN